MRITLGHGLLSGAWCETPSFPGYECAPVVYTLAFIGLMVGVSLLFVVLVVVPYNRNEHRRW